MNIKNVILDSLLIGLVTAILGSIILRFFISRFKNNNENLENMLEKYKKNYIIEISLFFTGVLIHLGLEYIGLSKWYCKKVCDAEKCEMVCTKRIS